MELVVMPPVLPMLAKRVDAVPVAGEWVFEPKWDGFRAVVFRDGAEMVIQSRDGKELNRYFPEVVRALAERLPEKCVVDGEIVIAKDGRLEFDLLSQRIHPAASRVKMLAETTPASVVLFDVLCVGEEDLRVVGFAERRARLEAMAAGWEGQVHVTPATRDRAVAEDWFRRFEGAGLDGVMAKPAAGAYTPDKRTMLKIKHERECDCVVAGYRVHKDGAGVGSLLLGLFDAEGTLQHVGVCASFTAKKRVELVEFLEPYRRDALKGHPWAGWAEASTEGRMPGAKSRWTGAKDMSWEPLRPELVAEVTYEHMQGDRFRHLAHWKRWRMDREPASCTYAQLEVVAPAELRVVLGG